MSEIGFGEPISFVAYPTSENMCQFRNVLIPTDFGRAAWNAVKFAINMCGEDQAMITLLHVYPSNSKFDSKSKRFKDEEQEEMNRIKREMKSFCEGLIKGKGLNIDSVILKGWVNEEILEFVKNHNFDLVIMGVNSNGFDNRPGSNIFKMIERVNAPLMIIPNSQAKVAVDA